MKKILSLSAAAAALIAAGCTTAAMASDQSEYRENVHVIVERDASDGQTIIIRGVDVETIDGDVFINGDALRTAADGRIVISGDNVRIINGGHSTFAFATAGEELELHLAEIEVQMESMRDMRIVVDDLHGEEMERALAHVEEELARNQGRRMVIVNGERREMTDEEREEVQRELTRAREEIAESMREVRIELRESEGERAEALRVMRIELEQAERELAEAGREARRVHVIARHNQDMHEDAIHELRVRGGRELRFVSEDGEERIWVDGEELEGDARTEWLNRLQVEELAGGEGSSSRSIVIEIDEDE
ncbi:hypothetical protein [Hyphobacterium sp.]|uniref:hypothetical protein n=1 Tax=Hyphobacterium sp. TaxID=2004662 RepID=UPI00374997D6